MGEYESADHCATDASAYGCGVRAIVVHQRCVLGLGVSGRLYAFFWRHYSLRVLSNEARQELPLLRSPC